ncbi:stage II sporulation protein E [Marinitoga sp. 1197]|uniref:cache domain-containing protein n=1 Tax=Marinitoga sp. 1197 TaxID=1428449 RepID=UPI000658693D|nr:cache domain-containing protein [Marinitoga sp. 1197]KLO23242.1 stage II sporulation protein E [Marinitoga sp. 1197]
MINRYKIVFPLLFISMLLIIGIGLFFSINYYNINLSKAQDYIRSENSVVATFIDDYFTELIHFAETFAKDKDFINAGFSKKSEEKVLEILKNYKNSNKNIAYIYTGYKNKKMVINDWEVPKEYDPTIRPWYIEGIKNPKSVYIGTPYKEYKTKKWLISTGKALVNEKNEVVGVLSIDCSISDFVNLINSELSYKTGQTFVINRKGTIILHKNIENINKKFEYIHFVGSKGIIKDNINNKSYYIAYTKLNSSGWYIVTMVEKAEVMSPIYKGVISYSIISISLLLSFVILQSILISNFRLKKLVKERTKELEQKNKRIMDSILYAKNIQNSILPSEKILKNKFKDFFVLWKPSNIVGGDFYWYKERSDGSFYIAVVDCTGHGVPGALMTMTANSILNRIIDDTNLVSPSDILQKLNILFKNTINSYNDDYRYDDGLEIGLCYISNNKLIYSGAGISLYYTEDNKIIRIKGDNKGIGYKRSKIDYIFSEHIIEIESNTNFYITSDGYEDQNNPEGKRLGRKTFINLLNSIYKEPMDKQKEEINKFLKNYMKNEDQRDDITVIGFKL